MERKKFRIKAIIDHLKKWPWGIIISIVALITTIIGVAHQIIKSKEDKLQDIVSNYIEMTTKMDRIEWPDSIVKGNPILAQAEAVQDEIEAYIRIISNLNTNSELTGNLADKKIVCQQRLMQLIQITEASRRYKDDIGILATLISSSDKPDLIMYIPYDLLQSSQAIETNFRNYLIKVNEGLGQASGQEESTKLIADVKSIFSSEELLEYLSKNEKIALDFYSNLNNLKIAYSKQAVLKKI